MPAKCLSDDRNMGGTADLSVPYIAICRGRFLCAAPCRGSKLLKRRMGRGAGRMKKKQGDNDYEGKTGTD